MKTQLQEKPSFDLLPRELWGPAQRQEGCGPTCPISHGHGEGLTCQRFWVRQLLEAKASSLEEGVGVSREWPVPTGPGDRDLDGTQQYLLPSGQGRPPRRWH